MPVPQSEPASPTSQYSFLYSDFFGVRNGNDRDQNIDQQIIALVREMEGKYNYSVRFINFYILICAIIKLFCRRLSLTC
jgi:hypothetical protein